MRFLFLVVHKTQLQWIKGLTLTPDTLNLKVENLGDKFELFVIKVFLNKALVAYKLRPTTDRWDHSETKNFYYHKEHHKSSVEAAYGMGKKALPERIQKPKDQNNNNKA